MFYVSYEHRIHMRGSREGQGVPAPEKSQSYRFRSNTDPNLLDTTKLPSMHSMLGHDWAASETPFKCHLNGVSLAGR